MRPLMSYLEHSPVFRRDTMDELVGRGAHGLEVDGGYGTRFLATRYGFLHRSERTVHEQLLFRLGRQRRRVRLFDIARDGTVERGAAACEQRHPQAGPGAGGLGDR